MQNLATHTARDKRVIELLALTGGASTQQLGSLMGTQPRNTRQILKRISDDGAGPISPDGRLIIDGTGHRPVHIWRTTDGQPQDATDAVLLTEYLIQHPGADVIFDLIDAMDAFEELGTQWRFPECLRFVCVRGEPLQFVIPISSANDAHQWLFEQQSLFRWSVLPKFEFVVVTTTGLDSLVTELASRGINLKDPFILKKRPAATWRNILRSQKPELQKYRWLIEQALKSRATEDTFSLVPRVQPSKTLDAVVHSFPLFRAWWLPSATQHELSLTQSMETVSHDIYVP